MNYFTALKLLQEQAARVRAFITPMEARSLVKIIELLLKYITLAHA